MSNVKMKFVSFEPCGEDFAGFLPMEHLFSTDLDPERVLQEASKTYKHSIALMRSAVAEIKVLRENRTPLPARRIWGLGDLIFKLVWDLRKLSLQLDDLYCHLARDLDVKRKWLEKVIILRRYVPEERLIPQSLSWGRLEKGTRKKAERLRDGIPLDK